MRVLQLLSGHHPCVSNTLTHQQQQWVELLYLIILCQL